jgi:uncharacterized protein YkwD
MVPKYVAMVLLAAMLAIVSATGAIAQEAEETEPASDTASEEPSDAERGTEVGAAAESCTGGQVNLSSNEKRMLELHNKTRADRRLPRLCVHPALQKAARAHSREMISKDRFSHGNVGQRLKKFGYRWSTYGENILRDPGSRDSEESLFKLWMKSSGHRANILEKSFREVGIGASSGKYRGDRTTMWTVDFGDR